MAAISLNDFFLDDQLARIKDFIEEEGQHPAAELEISYGWAIDKDAYTAHVYCAACDRVWKAEWAGNTIKAVAARGDLDAMTNGLWVPFFMRVAKSLCFRMSLVAELAEWITSRVADSGPYGVKYSALIAEATDFHLCAWQDVDTMLMKLGFLREWDPVDRPDGRIEVAMVGGVLVNDPWIMLPAGHPLRKDENG